MTTYRLKGLDCPVCADGLERGLRALEGVRMVSVDFATLSLKVDADDLEAVETAAKRIEPALELERAMPRHAHHGKAAASQPCCSACGDAEAPHAPEGTAGKAATKPGHHEHGQQEAGYELKREIIFFLLAGLAASSGFVLEGLSLAGNIPPLSPWLKPLPFLAAWLLAGWNVLAGALRNILRGRIFDELFLMGIATVGAFLIGNYEEAVGVMVFYKIGEMLQESAAARSRASVRALLDLRPDSARLRRKGAWILLPAEEAEVGDEALVFPGERLPLDGVVVEGEAFLDTKALTGEPKPRRAGPGDEALAGFIALDGSLRIRATKPAGESSAARIAELVENASHAKAKTERFISRFARVYTPIVVLTATAIAFLPPLLVPGQELATWAYRALVMLVISCPCALVVSVPLGYFGGIGGAARRGILVKGGEVLDALAKARAVVFDKTGTLTRGVFEVLEVEAEAGFSEQALLELAAAAESRSRHPIAASIRRAALLRGLSDGTEDDASAVRELPGRGVIAELGGRRVLAGNTALLEAEGIARPSGNRGATRGGASRAASTEVLVAVDGRYAGRIAIGDEIKPDAKRALAELHALGVTRTALLTGDAEAPARATAAELGIGEVHAGLLPEDKLERLSRIIEESGEGRVLFVGDGVNDAPVLARADVGVAMGAGADAAIESADLVLMTDEPSRVPEAIARARRTRRIVLENIVIALGIKAGFLVLGAFGIAVMWEAVIADVGVALLATLNATRAMR